MPKRYNNLFEPIIQIENLYDAYLTARKSKRKKEPIALFEKDLGANLQELHDELKSGTYSPGPYRQFWVNEGRKPRLVVAPAFRDVVVQHAVYSKIYPLLDRRFIHDNYGCRKNKGTHKASDRAQKFLRQSRNDSYVLQLDIKKFYYSIDHSVLESCYRKFIKDENTINLIMMFSKVNRDSTMGIPIGNLMSQLSGLMILNLLDHFIKRVLGVNKYVRYVDDMLLFDLDKHVAHDLKNKIENYIQTSLNLSLSKWSVFPIRRGVNFVGYRTWRKTRVVRKRSMFRFRRAMRAGRFESIRSMIAHSLRTSTFDYYYKIIVAERWIFHMTLHHYLIAKGFLINRNNMVQNTNNFL